MTSIYRQIGIGCESLFRQILADNLGLSTEDVKWSYEIAAPGNRNMNEIIGYDFAGFFERNSEILHQEVDQVLQRLLAAD